VVDGIPAYDPELGGEALAMDDVPGPIAMTYVGSQDPPAPRVAKKATRGGKAKAGDDTEGADGAIPAKKAAKKKATKKAGKKATKRPVKKATKKVAKKAKKRPARSSIGRPLEAPSEG
jgi:hypothetical protein